MDTVRQWISQPAITAPETMPLPAARQLMRERQVRRLPVVDAAGRLTGIVTEGDINRVSDSHVTDVRDYNMYHRVADLPISEIMTRAVVTVTPDTPIIDVARRLLDNRISGVPVLEDDRIVGVITESDLFRMIVSAREVELDVENEAYLPTDTTNENPSIIATDSLNAIIARYPQALSVLHRFGLDTCCGGALPLNTAAQHHGLNVDEVLNALCSATKEVGQ